MSRALFEVLRVEVHCSHSDAHESGLSIVITPGDHTGEPAVITLRIADTVALLSASTARMLAEALRQQAIEIDRPRKVQP